MKPALTTHTVLDGLRAALSQIEPRPLIVPVLLTAMVYLVWGHRESLTLFVSATALYAIGATVFARSAREELTRERNRRRCVEFDLRELKVRFAVLMDFVASLRNGIGR